MITWNDILAARLLGQPPPYDEEIWIATVGAEHAGQSIYDLFWKHSSHRIRLDNPYTRALIEKYRPKT